MASFNPQVQDRPDPDYLGKSKGLDAPRPNNMMEKLFESVGSLGTGIVKTIDSGIKTDITQQAQAGVDNIRSGVGVDTATDAASKGNTLLPTTEGTPQPSAIGKANSEVSRLKEAYDQGKINDSYYWGRVNAVAKQIRTQYPGYREEIDQAFSGITGANPANALRKAIQSDFDAAQGRADSAKNKMDQFEISKGDMIPQVMPDYYARKAAGNPYDFETMKMKVGQIETFNQINKQKMTDFELKDKQGKLEAGEVETAMVSQANNMVNQTSGAVIQSLGLDIQKLVETGKPLTPEQVQQIKGKYGMLRSQMEVKLNQAMNQPFGEDKTRTPAAVLKDAAKVKFIKDNALANLDSMQEALTNGNYGLFNQTANLAKASQEYEVASILQKSDAARKMQAAQSIAGPGLNAVLMTPRGQKMADDFSAAILDKNLNESLIGEGSQTQQLRDLAHPRLSTPGNPVLYKGAAARDIDNKVAVLSSPDIPVTAKSNVIKSMYGDKEQNFLTEFKSASDQQRVFQRMTAPEVTKQVAALRSSDPQAFEQYKKWATGSFSTLLKTNANTIADLSTYTDVKLSYDPATMQYTAAVPPAQATSASPVGLAMGAAGVLAAQLRQNKVNETLAPINAALRNLKPIINEDGKDNEALIKTLTGINPQGAKQTGLVQWLGEGALNVISGAVQGVGNAVVSPAKGATRTDEQPAANFKVAAYAPEETQGGISDSLIEEKGGGISFDGVDIPKAAAVSVADAPTGVKGLLDKIGQGEAGGSYNIIYGGRQAPLTDMTLGQVMGLQNQMLRNGAPSTAVGKYQFINKTLGNIARKMGVTPDTPFTPELQDKLAIGLMKGRGLDAYMNGSMSKQAFINSLAQEWAAVRTTSGRGHYDGDGLNKASLDIGSLVDSLKS